MRKRIFEIIEVAQEGDRTSFVYDAIMLGVIAISIVPMTFKTPLRLFVQTEAVATICFSIDYFLRLFTADYKLKSRSVGAFLKYPFTPWAIIDLLSILPAITTLNKGFVMLRLCRALKTLRVVRVLKIFRYSQSLELVFKVVRKSKDVLLAVCGLAFGYIFLCALVIFNAEPDSFNTFFDAVYWATVSLTTVGYGDICPVTPLGRIIAMISAFFGIAFIALPASIVTAGYMEILKEEREKRENRSMEVVHTPTDNN